MCGLILAPHAYLPKIEKALGAMAYRGPDNLQFVGNGKWVLGHVRLAIQDLTPAGNQPFQTSNDRFAAFVGEFFNHHSNEQDEVARILMDDPEFRLHRMDGFWSLAEVTPSYAHVFTDHLAIKPLYYWAKHQIVCSELEPMFELETRPPLDRFYLSNCVKWGYDYSGRTPYQGITQLAPGVRLCLRENGQSLMRRYWKWNRVPRNEDSLRHKIERSITNRLVSDRPVSMLLSGGLDSSIIYYTLKNLGREVQAFSVENGESEFLPDGVVPLPVEDVSVGEAVRIMQAPLDLGSMVPQVQLARAVKAAGYNVCLTGDGADELFGGYRRAQAYDSQHSDVFAELPYYHLPRLDRVMMASTIELRSPFLAPEIVAYALDLPHSYRTNKEALKFAFHGVVPNRIIHRPKHPLKTTAVIEGGEKYRRLLVDEFIKFYEEKTNGDL